MKVKPEVEYEVDSIETCFGELSEKKWNRGHTLVLDNKHFEVRILSDDKKRHFEIQIKYVIHRPCHDHDNFPEVRLYVPFDGVQECECGKHEERCAKLVIETDSGHLMLNTFFKDYVWTPEIPFDVWEALDKYEKNES